MPKQPLNLERVQSAVEKALDVLEQSLESKDEHVRLQAAKAVIAMTPIPLAEFEFKGHLSNQTDYTLIRESYTHCNDQAPPEKIGPGGTGHWSASNGGCESRGTVVYYREDNPDQKVSTEWYIPGIGYNTNKLSSTIPGTLTRHEGGSGWHAEVWYYLEEA